MHGLQPVRRRVAVAHHVSAVLAQSFCCCMWTGVCGLHARLLTCGAISANNSTAVTLMRMAASGLSSLRTG